MSDDHNQGNFPAGYSPPSVWTWNRTNGGRFANINRPIAGAVRDAPLRVGDKPLQLYSLGTPNGIKVTIMLEELREAGHVGASYDAWKIDIGAGDQFSSGFVDINPNSKVPALVDYKPIDGGEAVAIFESASILFYLAEKHGELLPTGWRDKTKAMNWLFWQMGSAPFVGGGFGHFYAYAPTKIKYAIDRFAMEAKRQLDVLDRHLADNRFMAGAAYTIADIALFPWYGALVLGELYGDAANFLQASQYVNLQRWVADVSARPGVVRGRAAVYS